MAARATPLERTEPPEQGDDGLPVSEWTLARQHESDRLAAERRQSLRKHANERKTLSYSLVRQGMTFLRGCRTPSEFANAYNGINNMLLNDDKTAMRLYVTFDHLDSSVAMGGQSPGTEIPKGKTGHITDAVLALNAMRDRAEDPDFCMTDSKPLLDDFCSLLAEIAPMRGVNGRQADHSDIRLHRVLETRNLMANRLLKK